MNHTSRTTMHPQRSQYSQQLLCRKRLLLLLLAGLAPLFTNCSTGGSSTTGASRPYSRETAPESTPSGSWALRSITLHTQALTGTCDLRASQVVRRLPSAPQTVYFEGLLHGTSEKNEGCQLLSSRFSPDKTSIVVAGNYTSLVPERMIIVVKVGDIVRAETHDDNQSLSKNKYEELENTEHGTVKFHADSSTTLAAICAAPVSRGIWGFRTQQVSCTFTGGAGSVTLEEGQ